MTTKPSAAPWADGPFPLIETPSKKIKSDHFYVHAASEMANAHNALIRSLNAILRQGPHLPTSTDAKYQPKDVKDFLTYADCWVQMVHHHHWVEETSLFPEMGKVSGNPGLMDEPKHQHEFFQTGLTKLSEYAKSTKPDEFRWTGENGMEQIMNSFTKDLTDHLYAEIGVLLSLKDLDNDEYKKAFARSEEVAKNSSSMSMLINIVPLVLGSADKSYEGGNDFPPFPKVMPYIVKYGVGLGNGAWRFNPCDFWGKPRPLAFVPQGASE